MSQTVSTHLIVPEPSEELIASEPWSIETYAEGLMDDLFADIDHILDGSDNLSSHTVTSKYIPMETVHVSPIVLPTGRTVIPGIANSDNSQLSQVVTPTLKNKAKQTPFRKKVGIFGRLVFVITTFGLAVTGLVWLMNSGLFNSLGTQSFQQVLQKSPVPSKPVVLTRKDIESDLASYILRALAVIKRQEANNSQSTFASKLNNRTALAYLRKRPNSNLPLSQAANRQNSASNQPSKVVERIYIRVPSYQAPLPMRYAPPAVTNPGNALPAIPRVPQKNVAQVPILRQNSTTQNQTAQNQTTNVTPPPQKKLKLKPVPVHTSSIAIKQSQQPALKPLPSPAVPQRTSVVPPPITPSIKELASVSVASPDHILRGLLELGEKSAALFEINGISRQIEIGENIGSSGWKLVDIEKGKAIIRRNGEVRSIFTGYKF